ncbi:MAG: chemotaxis protein CheB [Desulfuromonadaceae bacterium]
MKKQQKTANNDNNRDESSASKTLSRASRIFPIVGIGASAGGLKALELFLRHVPEKSGIAFVIVQHLDPTHKGIMPELLQRATGMDVFQVTDRMKVKPDCVYVIPPNRDMSILHGLLHLFKPTVARGLRLPIDFFLRSLAEDLQENSIGVILSGMGSDGTMGLRAIKEKAGLALVQEPASAEFESMPRSAIDAGLADLVAPAEALPGKIIDYLRHAHVISKADRSLTDKDQSALEKILILLRSKTGHDFSMYKKNTLDRRIERRMRIHQLDRIAVYVRYLQENPQEVELLFKELLIGVTNFFRDSATWEQLQREIVSLLQVDRPHGGMLRAWSVGCSSGEEAYSLAITFKEALEQVKPTAGFTLQIFATDLDGDAIDKARQGIYPANIAADVSPERLDRFFVREEDGYRVGVDIRSMVTFATQNVIMDPPFTKLDILICRNLLIYLKADAQKKLLPLFHYSLNPSGIPKESSNLKPAPNLQSLADQLLLQVFSPPAVLVNDKGDILYINGRTGKYLEPAAGKANWNIFAMAREGLRFELGVAFQKALRQKDAITIKNLKVGDGGNTPTADVTVQAIEEPEALRRMVMIVFREVTTPPEKKAPRRSKSASSGSIRELELEQEIRKIREELLTTREEMQSSQEEFKSVNEELQSANEELQSTNEELTTSREEMQSLNEELQTVNAEQQSKLDELSRLSNDMRNLLNSTEIVTVFLDKDLHVRRFTSGADQIFKLIPSDVGRPLSDITSDLVYPELTEDAREVLRSLVFSEKQIAATDGRWFSVRIMPYRTLEDVIVGVVITLADITETKVLEEQLHEEIAKLKGLLATQG